MTQGWKRTSIFKPSEKTYLNGAERWRLLCREEEKTSTGERMAAMRGDMSSDGRRMAGPCSAMSMADSTVR